MMSLARTRFLQCWPKIAWSQSQPCSLCSTGMFTPTSSPEAATSSPVATSPETRCSSGSDATGLASSEENDTAALLGLLNTLPESELRMLKFVSSKTAEGIVLHREKHGLFEKLDDILLIPGIGRRTLDNLRKDLSRGVQQRTTRIETQGTNHLSLTRERLQNLQDITAIDVGLKHVAWSHMDRQRWVHQWRFQPIEGISPGKWDPLNYLRLVSSLIDEMPHTDLYVLEHKSFTSLNKGTFQTMLFIRCLETMFYTSLNSNIHESGEVRAISLPQNAVGKHFGLLVGSQRKSGQNLVRTLLSEGTERRNAWFPVRIMYENALTFEESSKYEREHLANCLLRAIAFYDIYVDSKPGFKLK
ncbi:transcription elongation factor, mitochondrial-like [Diadema antillarum]|uniref:transcription elongation factor, mitochondrial-like n=1 Tax=Diadema antillarum TaxID=105358 RepID=UPI003A8BDE7B